ncbi:AraC family transcriptional regulator [Crenothrix sp.]|uniref:AraC family transcriptional regulator n=1 Tax=Crenothrix sp. TaxID=3100433 RepID=UPI00374DD6F4
MSLPQNKQALTPDAKQALNEILRRINFRAEVFYRGQLCDSWALDTSGTGNVNFHIVCHGNCWLHLPTCKIPTRLQNGDIVVFPHDAAHIIGSSEAQPDAFGMQNITRQVPLDHANPGTALICGFLEIDHSVRRLLMGALPEFIVIGAQSDTHNSAVRTLLDLLFTEAGLDAVGATAILDRLADALLFYIVRDLVEKDLPIPGLLGAFGDAQICNAVLAIHTNPGWHWTLDNLAETAYLSRSVFAERFFQACGMPPIEFLTLWRMYFARRWLEQDKASVMDVAERCGYESAAAFSKAFKRVMGVGPGQFRKIGGMRNVNR